MILLAGALAFLAGTAAAAFGAAPFWPLLLASSAGTATGFVLAGRRREGAAVLAVGAVMLLGIVRYESARLPEIAGGIAAYNDGAVVHLRGLVVAAPEQRERSQRLTLRVQAVREGESWRETSGRVLVTTRPFPELRYGDSLELYAALITPPRFDGFDYREYLARRGVVSLASYPEISRTATGGGSVVYRAIDRLRRPLSDALARALPEPEAALAQGILLGERTAIPSTVTDDLNRAGISHLVAISGYNIMLVAGMSLAFLSGLIGRRPAIIVSAVCVLLFALFVGAAPSVLRAAMMAVVLLGAGLAGRPGSGGIAVALVGALLVAAQPLVVHDVAFQLSFAATAGIVIVAQPLQERLAWRLSRVLPEAPSVFLAESLAVTTAASLAVLPVIAVTFGRVSLIALPANLLAGFVFPAILLSSALTAVLGALSATLGSLAGEVAYLPLAYLVAVGRTAADVPLASVEIGELVWPEVIALTAVVVALIALLLRREDFEGRVQPPAGFRLSPFLGVSVLLLLTSAFLWSGILAGGPGRLRLTVLDVGQGDAILIETPSGRRVLVDGGPSGARLMQALGATLPAGVHRIDLVVLTHGQDDHVTGLVELLERFEVGQVLAGPSPGTSAAFRAWEDAVAAAGLPVHAAVAGEWAALGDGVRLEVLNPPTVLLSGTDDDLNANSVVLRLVYDEVSVLLTGDIAADTEALLLRDYSDLRATVLKVAHHGSDGSSTREFIAAVQPQVAVIPAGSENPFGHPHPSTRLRLAGTPLLRTDLNGNVRFETDGRRVWTTYDRGAMELLDPAVVGAAP